MPPVPWPVILLRVLSKQGDCGYFYDGEHIIRAFWVSKPEIAGSTGHLAMMLNLYVARGEVSDIPIEIQLALKQETFLFAESKGFGDTGGFIIMFDREKLPFCGRAIM
jgi:hypothetical protein